MQVTLDKPITVHGPALIVCIYGNTDVVMVGNRAILPRDPALFIRDSVVVDGPGQQVAIEYIDGWTGWKPPDIPPDDDPRWEQIEL